MNDEVGNALASQGVSLYTVYGATEVGLINTFARGARTSVCGSRCVRENTLQPTQAWTGHTGRSRRV